MRRRGHSGQGRAGQQDGPCRQNFPDRLHVLISLIPRQPNPCGPAPF
ncbi:hypothetical protein SC1_00807 [Sphingopyxis sp. C-1]|nr:hypothetical protein SC1_00807 [Sphingopyxis sp. C-1]